MSDILVLRGWKSLELELVHGAFAEGSDWEAVAKILEKDGYYRVSDPALRFYYGVVARYRSELELDDPMEIWRKHIVEELDAYVGLIFERVAQQAYVRLRPALEFPIVREWGRWEGLDRDRRQTEIDIVARRTDGAMLTGAVKWSAKPVGISLHDKHLDMLTRLSVGLLMGARGAGTRCNVSLRRCERIRARLFAARRSCWCPRGRLEPEGAVSPGKERTTYRRLTSELIRASFTGQRIKRRIRLGENQRPRS
jgi:hypothetical protein